jgi:hypothetical protein
MDSVAAVASCHLDRAVVRGAEGCSKGQVCCADKRDSDTCTEPGASRLGNLGFDFGFEVPPPFIDIKRTSIVKKMGIPIGIKLWFKIKLKVTVKLDVTCVACGKSRRYSGIGIEFQKNAYAGKKITGVKFLSRALASAIPGVNLALLALEIKQAYDTFMKIKNYVSNFIAAVRGVRNAIRCKNGALTHADAKSAIIAEVDIDKMIPEQVEKKRAWQELLEHNEINLASENDLADALTYALSVDTIPTINLPDDDLHESEIDGDAMFSHLDENETTEEEHNVMVQQLSNLSDDEIHALVARLVDHEMEHYNSINN